MARETAPNVVALTVDALRADRMSVYGYERPTSPNLAKLGEQAIVCENALTLAPFTQAACIQLFTSSKPFSYGGYDAGAFGRPTTLFENFKNAGYSTWGLSTVHWVSPFYGYTDGLETNHYVFHMNALVGMAVVNMRDTLYYFAQGKMDEEEMLSRVKPVVKRMFDNIENYCDEMRTRIPVYKRDFSNARVSHDDFNFAKVKNVVTKHKAMFEHDHLSYIRTKLTNLTRAPEAREWITRDWHYQRTPIKLVCEFLFRATNKALRVVNPSLANKRAFALRLAADAHSIADKVIETLGTRDKGRPFFIWAHFKDTHRPYVSGPGMDWYNHTPDYLEALGYPRNLDPTLSYQRLHAKSDAERDTLSALYDAAVRSTDEAIGRIIDALREKGLLDDTVIGVSGDHGEEIGEHGDFGHECMGYEHNSRIPMIFKPAGGNFSGERTDTLVSSLDFSPTLAALAGISIPEDWAGAPVTSDAATDRDHTILETFCRGNCLFDRRPLYWGVRTKQYKYLCCEAVDPHHKHGTSEPKLFDLTKDPEEQNNIYHPDHPMISIFNEYIATRMREIPELSSERIDALLQGGKTEKPDNTL